jgi:hypothetical protein
VPRILESLPSCSAHDTLACEDMLSISESLINRSAHRSGTDLPPVQISLDLDEPAEVPAQRAHGVTLAAATNSHSVPSLETAATTTLQQIASSFGRVMHRHLTLGAMSEAVTPSGAATPVRNGSGATSPEADRVTSPEADGSGSSSDDGARAADSSPPMVGPRHVFQKPLGMAGDAEVDGASCQQPKPGCADGAAAGGNDCEARRAPEQVRAASGAVAEAAIAVSAVEQRVDQASLPPTVRAQRYLAELLHLRSVVGALGAHLDVMIASSQGTVSISTRSCHGKWLLSDESNSPSAPGDVSPCAAPAAAVEPSDVPAGTEATVALSSNN